MTNTMTSALTIEESNLVNNVVEAVYSAIIRNRATDPAPTPEPPTSILQDEYLPSFENSFAQVACGCDECKAAISDYTSPGETVSEALAEPEQSAATLLELLDQLRADLNASKDRQAKALDKSAMPDISKPRPEDVNPVWADTDEEAEAFAKLECDDEYADKPEDNSAQWQAYFDQSTLAISFRTEYDTDDGKTGILKVEYDYEVDGWYFHNTLYDDFEDVEFYTSNFLHNTPGPALVAAVNWALENL